MNQPDPLRSFSHRLWSLVLGLLGLVIVANLIWTLLRPLLPVVAVIGVGVLVMTVWQRWRWR